MHLINASAHTVPLVAVKMTTRIAYAYACIRMQKVTGLRNKEFEMRSYELKDGTVGKIQKQLQYI